MTFSARAAAAAVAVLLAVGPGAVPPAVAGGAETSAPPERGAAEAARLAGWRWPLDSFRITRPYAAPAHRYGPGHRGIDLESAGEDMVRSPAAGVVAFAGPVAGRGVVTIDHGGGLVTTLEPVSGMPVPGTRVAAGDPVGSIGHGGHAAPGAVHFGVREHGEYINPMLLLGDLPRAILLPCC